MLVDKSAPHGAGVQLFKQFVEGDPRARTNNAPGAPLITSAVRTAREGNAGVTMSVSFFAVSGGLGVGFVSGTGLRTAQELKMDLVEGMKPCRKIDQDVIPIELGASDLVRIAKKLRGAWWSHCQHLCISQHDINRGLTIDPLAGLA